MNDDDSKVSRPGIEYVQTADLVNRVNMESFYIVMFWLYLLNDIILMFVQKKCTEKSDTRFKVWEAVYTDFVCCSLLPCAPHCPPNPSWFFCLPQWLAVKTKSERSLWNQIFMSLVMWHCDIVLWTWKDARPCVVSNSNWSKMELQNSTSNCWLYKFDNKYISW